MIKKRFTSFYLPVGLIILNSFGPLLNRETFKLLGTVNGKLTGCSLEGIAFAIPVFKISEYLNLNFDK